MYREPAYSTVMNQLLGLKQEWTPQPAPEHPDVPQLAVWPKHVHLHCLNLKRSLGGLVHNAGAPIGEGHVLVQAHGIVNQLALDVIPGRVESKRKGERGIALISGQVTAQVTASSACIGCHICTKRKEKGKGRGD